MTDLDDRIKTLLEERARDHVTDPRLPRTVVTRSRRRRAVVAAGAGLAAVAAIVVGAAALREVAFERQTGDGPTVTPSPDLGPVAGYPDTFVGLRDGEIVLVDVTSGRPIRVLVDRANLGGGAGGLDLEVSPDGSTVYFVPSGTPERIMRVPAEGGEPSLVAEGSKPTISPDGRFLAYVACDSPYVGCGNAILIRELAGGGTTVWDLGANDRWVGQLTWLPDSRNVAFSMFYPGDSNPTLHTLDTAETGVELKDVEEIGPDRRGAGWTVNGYHAPTGGLVVQHYCCSTSATDAPDESSVISVTADGRVVTTLLLTADWIDIELDASEQHFLLLDLGGAVYRVDRAGGEPQPIAGAEGFEHIDW
jgi:WD40-like Beta Propeller Repeat